MGPFWGISIDGSLLGRPFGVSPRMGPFGGPFWGGPFGVTPLMGPFWGGPIDGSLLGGPH